MLHQNLSRLLLLLPVSLLLSCSAGTVSEPAGDKPGSDTPTECGSDNPTGECPEGQTCVSGACQAEAAPTCTDITQNQDETDIDCGGPCDPCPSGTYKKDVGGAVACTPCPDGQWSATRSVDEADCLMVPKDTVSEVCPISPPELFGEKKFAKCQLRYSLQDLYDANDNKTLSFRMGSLDKLTVEGVFETWFCIQDHPCATDLTDNHFCFVWHESEHRFVAWGANPSLKLLVLPVTQDEVLHLRAENEHIKMQLANLTAENEHIKMQLANLTALVDNLKGN